ncbi:MAG: DNA alkylation repair protein [Anaerolineae bacterium]
MENIHAERQKLLAQIEALADEAHRAGMQMAVPTGLKMYGLRVPQIRDLAKAWSREHKAVERAELWALFEALWAGDSREELMLASELLQRYKRWIPQLEWAQFDRWRRRLDNWEVTDSLGQRILGPWMLNDPESRVAYLYDLIQDEDVWSRRLALVTTTWLNRGRKDLSFPDVTLELVDRVKSERHPMITKAVSWALRELTKKHVDVVARYLDANTEMLAPHVVREVRSKLETGRKN